MDVSLFDFELPEKLIAQTPLANRTQSRLLTLDRRTGDIAHRNFTDFIDLLEDGDTLILNDTRVIPARLFGTKPDTGGSVEVLLLKQLEGDRWEALVRPGKRVKTGTVITFGEGPEPLLTATVEAEGDMGERTLAFQYRGIFTEILDQLGHMPLPPYIRETLPDRERYQTVYAREAGSAAAPTAGLHFTEAYLEQIREKGIQIAYVTLHVGLGTFRPVSVDNIHEHKMHAEYYEVPPETAAAIQTARAAGKRVIAVGTTSARTLETAAASTEDGRIEACSGWTDIFIYPGYTFRCVDALLTNFHLPKSTLLMMISALAGREPVLAAYNEAVEKEYRFFSFGDAMFIY
ncbi:tRNA preQ1(34) S-adenosylmethionine ribosyltransferase-isomerase QueA [Paenibacillus turpanensis]|uniref:tRNA preQ1(34) S-adenosylmethionine ribosyltransferase-isomerase QueA n=1 Tax=Paenibacillus turpanensis TaxID=2689078 RepID=UPI0014095278|nr:tRNA preQ1(34) S-adenosylmethionine ribosyltransferase-isomerase QueA [Paenibacillus turpanensis]